MYELEGLPFHGSGLSTAGPLATRFDFLLYPLLLTAKGFSRMLWAPSLRIPFLPCSGLSLPHI
jgi:hypothetical protein